MTPNAPNEYWFEQITLLKRRVSDLEAAVHAPQATFRQRLHRLLRRLLCRLNG